MSTQPSSFGQANPFGSPAPAASPADGHAGASSDAPTPGSNRTVVIAVAAGVLALGVLGGAAALVFTGGDDAVETAQPTTPVVAAEPSAEASTPVRTPLATAAVQARNVFVPLVEEASSGSGDEVVDPVAAVAEVTAAPVPTAAPVLPAPTVTETVVVEGPVSTVTSTVPGPTTTATATATATATQTVSRFNHDVTIVAVADDTSATSDVTFEINGVTYDVVDDATFADVFTYNGYDVGGATVMFQYGSTMYSLPVGTRLGLGVS